MRELHEQRQHAVRRPSARPAGRPARTPGLAEPAGLRRTSAGLALVLGLLVTIVMVFLTPGEAGKLYERRVQRAPVRALTGPWILLPLAGATVWFVKTNGALNGYWRSLGAR
ncbi:MAG TPA: hypothetical protein VFI21_07165 [Nocardioides sp.]|nr:hypothetical protein [Nocardioides sp.]